MKVAVGAVCRRHVFGALMGQRGFERAGLGPSLAPLAPPLTAPHNRFTPSTLTLRSDHYNERSWVRTTMNDELQPIDPAEAKRLYLDQRKQEVSESTIQAHHYWLKHFVKWSDKAADSYDRKPLVTSRSGRAGKSSLRDSIYRITRPCQYTGECPHDREIESCEAMEPNKASTCPSSVSPHAIRRGSITYHLSRDVPEKIVTDRMNVSLDVLEKHYDRRGEQEKAEQRRDHLDSI